MILAEVIITPGSIRKNSLVKKPAIEVDTLKLHDETLKFSKDFEKQNLTGPVLIPNKKIYRNAEFFQATMGLNEDGYIYFTPQAVKSAIVDYVNNGNNSINLQHKEDTKPGDTELHEVWFIETENDKAYDLGFSHEDCPMGTGMMTLHINNPEIWSQVKGGEINGFSIEGSPALNIVRNDVQMNSELYNEDQVINAVIDTIRENI